MSFDTTYGEIAFGEESGAESNVGVITIGIEQESISPEGSLVIQIQQISAAEGDLSIGLEQRSHFPEGDIDIGIEQASYVTGSLTIGLQQSSYDPIDNRIWRLIVMLNGIDISASITGSWRVDAREGSARIAEFSMMPALGAIDPTDWVRQPVTLDYAAVDILGTIQWQRRLFTGIVDVPEYDPTTRITRFACTDRLQERLEQSDSDEVDSLIGGYWSQHIFDATADGWRRAQDRLSTQAASYDLDAKAIGWLTNWAAKGTADFSYTSTNHIDGSRRLELANSRDLHNRVRINFDFRFQRLTQRDINRSWQMYPQIGCTFLKNPFTLPTRDMILAAANATGWTVQSIGYVDLPPPQYFYCPGSGGANYIGWSISLIGPLAVPNPGAIAPLCQGAYVKLSKRWSQTVTEQYQMDVQAPQSIIQIGEIGREEGAGLEAEQDITGWEETTDYTGISAGAVARFNGDWFEDADTGIEDGRAAAEAAMICLQARGKAGILNSHRQNYVTWKGLINPSIERHHTVDLTTTEITAKGKISRLAHTGNILTGEAITEIRIALSRTGATGAEGDDPLDAPEVPDTQPPTADGEQTLYLSAGSNTHIGGQTTSPVFNEAWDGFVTNYGWDGTDLDPFATNPDNPTTVIYPIQFRIPVPEIESSTRQAIDSQMTTDIKLDIPIDTLTIN